jgi:hypothetical protein
VRACWHVPLQALSQRRANWKTRNSFDRRASAASGQKFAAFVALPLAASPKFKVALDISALPVSLFEMQANLIARKIQGSMSPDTSLNVSGLTRPRVCNVRRDKAALSSGCKPHPANAPAGSNRSRH